MNILTVSQLNTYLRELLDADEIVSDIWIEGEVSNFVRASSGHCYFTLKEGEAQIKSACWRSSVARIPAMPGNGDAVLAHGRVAFYEAPSPKDPPYVQEGDTIEPGDRVGIVEAMKMMNEIESEIAGRVVRILVKNGQPVEYGQPLMIVEPL